MDISFGEIVKNDNEVFVPVQRGDGKPMFKQFNGVVVESVEDDTITFNLQGRDISSYDEDLIAAGKENRKEWWGRELADKTIEKAYSSPVDEGVLTTLRHPKLRCFDSERQQVEIDSLKPGNRCDVVVELNKLWFLKRSFGPDWFSVQIKIHPEPETDPYDDYLFQDE